MEVEYASGILAVAPRAFDLVSDYVLIPRDIMLRAVYSKMAGRLFCVLKNQIDGELLQIS